MSVLSRIVGPNIADAHSAIYGQLWYSAGYVESYGSSSTTTVHVPKNDAELRSNMFLPQDSAGIFQELECVFQRSGRLLVKSTGFVRT